jgi:hypothetical protein
MLLIALVFVWRSFYAMRIPKEEQLLPDKEAASMTTSGDHTPVRSTAILTQPGISHQDDHGRRS